MTATERIAPYYRPVILTSTGADEPGRNHLLYEFGLNYDSSPLSETIEWLFQLTRHWWLWQHPHMGTPYCPVGDPNGPVPREWSEESGEDSVYYTIADILDALPTDNDRIRTILHTYAVLNRLYNLHESTEGA